MKRLLVLMAIFCLFGLGVFAYSLSLVNPDVSIFNTDAWFKYFYFDDGSRVVADYPNDTMRFVNHSPECIKFTGEEPTDTIHIALNPECLGGTSLPIYQGGQKNGLSFLQDSHITDFDYWCQFNGVCEMGLHNKYGYSAVFSQDNADFAISTNSEHFTLANAEYTIELPADRPEIGQCLKVTGFRPNRSYEMSWEDC